MEQTLKSSRFAPKQQVRRDLQASMMSTEDQRESSEQKSQQETPKQPHTLRVLALHGSGETAESFRAILDQWNELLQQQQQKKIYSGGAIQLEITALTAPFPKEGTNGYCWWTMPPGVRSFQATEYFGFDTSAEMVLEALHSTSEHDGPDTSQFDLIIAHSQGAILMTALLALDKIQPHPSVGYILNGVAWPNPFTTALENLVLVTNNDKDSALPNPVATVPRVLIILGDEDTINPPDSSYRVQEALQKAGCHLSVVHHPNGHSLPLGKKGDNEAVQNILQWILSGEMNNGNRSTK